MTQGSRGIEATVDMAVAGHVSNTAAPVPPPKVKRPYLYQIDLFRILTFACVVADHVTSGVTVPDNVASNGVQLLLHFTREAFFALTGFVLIYQYARRPFSSTSFWRRRFALIGIPYVVWSVFYWGYSIYLGYLQGSVQHKLWQLIFVIVTGQAWYQLYFLLVTMQIYLLFPLLLRLLRATEGHHRWVLAVSGALQLVFLWYAMHPPLLTGVTADVWSHIYVLVISYQFYVVMGAVAAWHIDAVNDFVHRFAGWIVAGALLSSVLAVLLFLRSTSHGLPPWEASNVFTTHLLAVFVLIIAALYTVASWWNRRRRDGSWAARAVSWGSDRSFAIFLLHPFPLQLLAPYIVGMVDRLGSLGATLVVYVAVMAMSMVGVLGVGGSAGSQSRFGLPAALLDS